MTEYDLPTHYRTAVRTLIRFAIVMAIVGLLIGILYQESSKKLPFTDAPAGIHIESVIHLALVHGHVFVIGVLLPLALAGALLMARRIGGDEIRPARSGLDHPRIFTVRSRQLGVFFILLWRSLGMSRP